MEYDGGVAAVRKHDRLAEGSVMRRGPVADDVDQLRDDVLPYGSAHGFHLADAVAFRAGS
ncbi:hypothetical protein SAZ11_12330 [Streptomyces sp. FXJ1.4098]|nr:hypothetical protein [Streptomyces sp. FXJ1.4098]